MKKHTIIKTRIMLIDIINGMESELQKHKKNLLTLENTLSDEAMYLEAKYIMSQLWKIDPEELLKHDRNATLVIRKHIFRWFCVYKLGIARSIIGQMTGYNHSTIINSIKYVNNELYHEEKRRHPIFVEEFAKVEDYIKQFD